MVYIACDSFIALGASHGKHAEGNLGESCFLGANQHTPERSVPEMPYVPLTEALATVLCGPRVCTGLLKARCLPYPGFGKTH